jgi:hypothetical protein
MRCKCARNALDSAGEIRNIGKKARKEYGTGKQFLSIFGSYVNGLK